MSDVEWQVTDVTPPVGERVRVKHERGTYGFGTATGEWDGKAWSCSELFIDPETLRIYRTPTHWAPLQPSA